MKIQAPIPWWGVLFALVISVLVAWAIFDMVKTKRQRPRISDYQRGLWLAEHMGWEWVDWSRPHEEVDDASRR